MNALLKQDYQVVSFPSFAQVAAPALVSVDLQELNRATYAMLKAEEAEIASTVKPKMTATVDGKLVVKTLSAFLTSGVKNQIIGLTRALNIQNHAERLDALHTLESYYSIFKSRKAASVDAVTPEMLRRERELIAMFPESHTPSAEWIAAYKAKADAAFEGKAARMTKKDGFCTAINAAAK